jgi:hypothetical protein
MAKPASDTPSTLLRDAAITVEPVLIRVMRRLITPRTKQDLQAETSGDVHTFQPTEEGSGIFGRWQLDANSLPCYQYELDQYADPRAFFPNSAGIDRRDHWHQIGNDRITGLASNDGTVQVYIGDRGGVFLNLFAARDEPEVPETVVKTLPERLLAFARQALTLVSRIFFRLQFWWRRQRVGRPHTSQRVQQVTSHDLCPRGAMPLQPDATSQAATVQIEPARFAYTGGFGYVNDRAETWSTAFRYRKPGTEIQRVFGLGYYETKTDYRNVRVTRRVYAPYGDHPYLIADVEFENLGTDTAELRYYEYWDVNVYQLKLQWLRGDPFAAAADEERSAINHLFLPQMIWDEEAHALRFHQQYIHDDFDPDAVSEIDFSPADIFLADLTARPAAYYTDKFAFFGDGGPTEPRGVRERYDTIPDAPSTDSMPYCMVLRCDLSLASGQKQSQRYAYGTVRPGGTLHFLDEFRHGEWLSQTLDCWKKQVLYFHTGSDPALKREMAWHAYYLLSAAVYNAYYRTHLIPQGSAYLYIHGADGAPRDQALFSIPLVYLRPDLARDTLRLIMSLQHHRTGAIPYSFSGHGYQHNAHIHDAPSDLDLFFLMAFNEYLAATGDIEFLDGDVPYYSAGEAPQLPPGALGRTVLDHVRAAVVHLVNAVGTGEHGLIRIGDGDWSDAVVFETVTRIGGVLFPAWFENSKAHGESIPNTQMALHVLPQTIALLQDHDPELSAQLRQFLSGLEEAVQRQWNGRWYTRAILRDPQNRPVILDNNRINLESQIWALISGAARRNGSEGALLRSVAALLDDPSPTGAPILEGEQVWPAISQLLTWGYCRNHPELAWRSLLRHTFAAHSAVFPDIWINIWSGPDAVYCKASTINPGGTWQSAATPMTDFPVMNSNPHAMALLGLLRVCGIEPSDDGQGLVIDPHVPRERFTLDTALLRLDVSPDCIAGEYRAVADSQRALLIRVPNTATSITAWVGGQSVPVEPDQLSHVRLRLELVAGTAVPFEVCWSGEPRG